LNDPVKDRLAAAVFAAALLAGALGLALAPKKTTSMIENRELAAMPELTAETVASGAFADGLDD
jgi:hypothetical protein